jgi:chromosomal replication initiator protein
MPVSSGGLELWAAVLARAEGGGTPSGMVSFLRDASVEACSADEIQIAVPSPLSPEHLAEARDILVRSAEDLLGRKPSVDIVSSARKPTPRPVAVAVAGPEFPPAQSDVAPASGEPGWEPPDIAAAPPLNENYTFDKFVIGPSNRLAHAAAVAVSEAPGQAYNPLFLHSASGMGKTHLLQATCSRVLERWPRTALAYISCEDFQNQFFSAVQAGGLDTFRSRFRYVQLLVVDDIHFLANRERTQEEFFHTFNTLYNAQRQIILSSDCPPREIPQIQERLVSRFKWGLVAEIEPPGFETRLEILRLKLRMRNFDLPRDVMEYLAHKVDTSIRELEGTVLKLVGYARLLGSPVDLPLAREAVEGPAGRGVHGRPANISDIVDIVADYYGITPSQVQARSRARSVALPRQLCMYLARELTPHSLESIGSFFGGRDHSTVKHACDKINELVDEGGDVANAVRVTKRKLMSTDY